MSWNWRNFWGVDFIYFMLGVGNWPRLLQLPLIVTYLINDKQRKKCYFLYFYHALCMEAHLGHLESTIYLFSLFCLSLKFRKLFSPFPWNLGFIKFNFTVLWNKEFMKRIFTVSFKCGIHKLIFLDMRMKIFLQIREFPKILETMKKN